MAKKLTMKKAKMMMKDGMVHGKEMTEKQKGFFGAIAGGAKMRKNMKAKKFKRILKKRGLKY